MKRLDHSRLPKRCRCGKLRCRSLEHARQIHAIIWAELGGEYNVRFYQCQFGFHHWTRQTNPNYHLKETA